MNPQEVGEALLNGEESVEERSQTVDRSVFFQLWFEKAALSVYLDLRQSG